MGALVAASVLAQQQQQHQAVQQSSSTQSNILGGTAGLVNSNAVSTGGATNTSSMMGVQGVPGVTGLGRCDHFGLNIKPDIWRRYDSLLCSYSYAEGIESGAQNFIYAETRCLSCVYNCDDQSCLHVSLCSSNM